MSNNNIIWLAPEIFSVSRPGKAKPKPKAREYNVVWPCGSTWTFSRKDLDIPDYVDGEQTGLTHCFDSIREAKYCLEAMGCIVEVVR